MTPIPHYQKMVGVEQAANANGNVRNAPGQQCAENAPYKRAAPATMAPCQRKIALMSIRLYPIERRIAISLTFESTVMVSTLKMPNPANSIINETVIAADIRRVSKS